MKILIISQYFYPELGAGSARVYSFAKYLNRLGHHITVLCGVPNYPIGKIVEGYKNRPWLRENYGGVNVYRTLVYPSRYTSNFRRFLNYFVFTVSSFFVGVFLKKPDIIIASSPPPSSGVTGFFLSYIKSAPLVFEVRDIWPGAASALGHLKNPLFLKLNLFLEQKIYKKSRFIIVPTKGTKNIILDENKNIAEEKVRVITNAVDLSTFRLLEKKPFNDPKLKGKFVVTYTGTLGLQQGVGTLIEVAKFVRDYSGVIFLIIGEGTERHLIEETIKIEKLENIILKNVVPYREVVKYLKKSDLGLTLLKKNKYLDAAYPVKAFDYMAAGIPVLVSGGQAMGDLVEENKAGFWVPAEDARTLAKKILEISKMPKEELDKMGRHGRKLVESEFNREKQAKKLEKILEEVVKR